MVYQNRFSVKRMYKGSNAAEVKLESFPESDPCFAPMEVGDPVLIVAVGNPPFLNCCHGVAGNIFYSRPDKLEWLDKVMAEYLK